MVCEACVRRTSLWKLDIEMVLSMRNAAVAFIYRGQIFIPVNPHIVQQGTEGEGGGSTSGVGVGQAGISETAAAVAAPVQP